MRHDQTLLAIGLAILGFACFSVTDIAGKYLITRYGMFELSFWYGLLSLLSLLPVAHKLGGWSATFKTKKMHWHMLRTLLACAIPVLNIYALAHIQLVDFYTIVFIAPFLTALIAIPFIKESVPLKRWLIIGGGFLGVVIGLRPDINGIGLPVLAVMTTATFFSLRSLIVPKMGAQETLLSLGLYPYIGITLFSLIGMLIFEQVRFMAPPDMLIIMISSPLGIIGIITTSVAFRMAPAAAVAPTHYTQMIWGLLFGYLIFSDIPDLWMMIGAGIVCICGIALIFSEGKGLRFFSRRRI